MQRIALRRALNRFLPSMKFLTAFLLFLTCAMAPAAKPKEFVFLPAKGEGPFPVAVWLHGYRGCNKDGYIPSETRDSVQGQVDALGIAIVGFPATTELDDGTQMWS